MLSLSLYDRKETYDIDAYETYIPDWSPLIGKTLSEAIDGYEDKIIIDHIHNSPIELETRKEVTPKTVFKKGMSDKIFGEWKDIWAFKHKYELP